MRALVRRTDGAETRAAALRSAEREIARAENAPKHEVDATRGSEVTAADVTVETTPYEEVNEGFRSSSAKERLRKAAPHPGLPVGEASLVIVAQRTKVARVERPCEGGACVPSARDASGGEGSGYEGVRALLK